MSKLKFARSLLNLKYKTFVLNTSFIHLKAYKNESFGSRCYTKIDQENKKRLVVNNNDIKIQSTESEFMEFPIIWLRDNCQCPECFHMVSKSRIINWEHFDVNVKIEDIVLKNDDLIIRWSDHHKSQYTLDWLKRHNFTTQSRNNYTENEYRPRKISWSGDEFKTIFKTFNFNNIMTQDDALKDWIKNLSVYGVALVSNVPDDQNSCRNLANRVEFIKRTHYGEEFSVKAKPGTTNVAYLSSNLQLHTDLPYYEYKPGVNLLHCVTQTAGSGGENLLCDGLYVANQLKIHNIEDYNLLKEIEVDWEDYGEEDGNKFHSIYRSPVICENKDSNIVRINYSTPQRGSHFNVPVETVTSWYKALKKFVNLIYEQSAVFKMKEGNILCFDNKRLLHGRKEYKDTEDNYRHVIGVYLDWDFVYSRLRVIDSYEK